MQQTQQQLHKSLNLCFFVIVRKKKSVILYLLYIYICAFPFSQSDEKLSGQGKVIQWAIPSRECQSRTVIGWSSWSGVLSDY